jgi:hypothetical protein
VHTYPDRHEPRGADKLKLLTEAESLSLSLSKPDALARSRGRAVTNCHAWQTYTYTHKITDKTASCYAYVLLVIGIRCCAYVPFVIRIIQLSAVTAGTWGLLLARDSSTVLPMV